jgi:hypothetical protein
MNVSLTAFGGPAMLIPLNGGFADINRGLF